VRILNVILDGYPTFRPDVTALFGRYLPRLGIHTDLVTQVADGAGSTGEDWGGGHTLLCRRTGNRVKDQLIAFANDIKALWHVRRPPYDAIQIRDKVFIGLLGVWVARVRGVPAFYWMSFPLSEGYVRVARDAGRSIGLGRYLFLMLKGHVGRALIYRHVLPRCAHVFVQSDRMLDDLAARGIARNRMTAVPMGVDPERPVPTRSEALHHDKLQGRRVVAYLGSFERARRLEFLLEVMREVGANMPDTVLLMIGDSTEPEDRERLQRKADALGIAERVVWTGWVSPTDAWRWLVNADVAVSIVPRDPLYDCASPTKVVEYLALGIPVVANDQPDQRSVIEASGAGVCLPMDRAGFASAIEDILSNPETAEHMRAAGRGYAVMKRGYDRIAMSVAEAYRQHVEMAV
jgi:glycosyltransferase involved in cell wall biosynthesis